jgi:hypothetical protein
MQAEARFQIVSLSDAATNLLPADSQISELAKKDPEAFSTEKIAVY